MSNDIAYTCGRCGEEYILRYGAKPTTLCDMCAHAVVAEQADLITQLRAIVAEYDELGRLRRTRCACSVIHSGQGDFPVTCARCNRLHKLEAMEAARAAGEQTMTLGDLSRLLGGAAALEELLDWHCATPFADRMEAILKYTTTRKAFIQAMGQVLDSARVIRLADIKLQDTKAR